MVGGGLGANWARKKYKYMLKRGAWKAVEGMVLSGRDSVSGRSLAITTMTVHAISREEQ